jgi:hypothetical protein
MDYKQFKYAKPPPRKNKPLRNKRITEYIPCTCGGVATETHEPLQGKNRQLSIKYKLQIKLCEECHTKAHKDKVYKEKLKQDMQRKFEAEHSREEFVKIFGRNYIDCEVIA